jgi:hypothetical protein
MSSALTVGKAYSKHNKQTTEQMVEVCKCVAAAGDGTAVCAPVFLLPRPSSTARPVATACLLAACTEWCFATRLCLQTARPGPLARNINHHPRTHAHPPWPRPQLHSRQCTATAQ